MVVLTPVESTLIVYRQHTDLAWLMTLQHGPSSSHFAALTAIVHIVTAAGHQPSADTVLLVCPAAVTKPLL